MRRTKRGLVILAPKAEDFKSLLCNAATNPKSRHWQAELLTARLSSRAAAGQDTQSVRPCI